MHGKIGGVQGRNKYISVELWMCIWGGNISAGEDGGEIHKNPRTEDHHIK